MLLKGICPHFNSICQLQTDVWILCPPILNNFISIVLLVSKSFFLLFAQKSNVFPQNRHQRTFTDISHDWLWLIFDSYFCFTVLLELLWLRWILVIGHRNILRSLLKQTEQPEKYQPTLASQSQSICVLISAGFASWKSSSGETTFLSKGQVKEDIYQNELQFIMTHPQNMTGMHQTNGKYQLL